MGDFSVLGLLMLGALAFGFYRKWSDGQAKKVRNSLQLSATDIGAPLGEKATLLQFSSAFCSPCRTTKQLLGKLAPSIPGVAHVEVDAESNLELVRRLDISRTPTTLILNAKGEVKNRVVGVPRQADLLKSLAEAID
jgi:thiol-disulfide isomerase/thioredoxin